MRTFERIRKISPYFFGLFALLLVAYFVFTSGAEDVLKYQGSNPQSAELALVNGQPILYAEFEKKVRDQVEQERAQQKTQDADIDETQIRTSIWNQMLEEMLIEQEAKKAGIIVTDEELRDLLLENPPDYLKRSFIDSAGNFMKALYLDVMTNPDNLLKYIRQDPSKTTPEEKAEIVNDFRKNLILVTDLLRKQKLTEGMMSIVNSAGSIISPTFAKEKYIAENSTANVNYIIFDVNSIPNERIKVTDEEIKKYYDANSKYYKQKAQRRVKYVSLPIVPSLDDTLQANKKINKIINDLMLGTTLEQKDSIFDVKLTQYNGQTQDYKLVKDVDNEIANVLMPLQEREIIGPINLKNATYFLRVDGRRKGEQEVVKASHILIKFGDNKDSAKAEAEKILKLAKSGEDFAKLAKENSEDKGSAQKGGDLGYFGKGNMIKEFEEAAFNAKPGDIVGPVETQYGYHIIKVEDKKSDEIKYSFIEIAPKISSATKNKIKRDAYSLKTQVEKGAKFNDLAKSMNLTPVETPYFEKTKPVIGSNYIRDMAFNSDVGTVLEPIELKFYGLTIVQITGAKKEGTKSLEDMKEEIKKRLTNIKKLDILKQKAQDIYNKISSQNVLEGAQYYDPTLVPKTASNIKNNGLIPGVGRDFVFTEEAFLLPLNKISTPIRGEKGYYLMIVTDRKVPDETTVKNELSNYTEQLKNNMKGSSYYQWFSKIKENADIEDFRSKYFREY